jgi:hypothetical protein
MASASGGNFTEIYLRSGHVASAADATDAFLRQRVITEVELRRAPHPPAPNRVLPQPHSSIQLR